MALFDDTPRLKAWIAVCGAEIAGYVTAAAEYATWAAEEHLHMDCLYVRPGFRNSGMGAALLSAVVQYANDRGYQELQWQTPEWNSDACRFYRRHGAYGVLKVRFRLEPAAPHPR